MKNTNEKGEKIRKEHKYLERRGMWVAWALPWIYTALVFVRFLLPSCYTALSKVSDLIDDEKNGQKMRIITSDILYRQKSFSISTKIGRHPKWL